MKFDDIFWDIKNKYFSELDVFDYYDMPEDASKKAYGMCAITVLDEGVFEGKIMFNKAVKDLPDEDQIAIIKHELVHYKIYKDNQGVLGVLFPHGFRFIRESFRCENNLDATYHLIHLGTKGFRFEALKETIRLIKEQNR